MNLGESDHVINYLVDLASKEEKNSVIEEEIFKLEALRKKQAICKELLDSNFARFKDVDVLSEKSSSAAESVEFLTDLFTIDGVLFENPEKAMLFAHVAASASSDNLPQTKAAHDLFMSLLSKLYTAKAVSARFIKEKSIKSETFELVHRILYKTPSGSYGINGSISEDDQRALFDLIDSDAHIDIADRIAFTRTLCAKIIDYNKTKESINENAVLNKKEEILERDLIKTVPVEEDKTTFTSTLSDLAPFNYKTIIKYINKIGEKFEADNAYNSIDENTPFDTHRLRAYYIPNSRKSLDFRVVLYDYNNFINPENIEKLYSTKQITAADVNCIRNVIYKSIISNFDKLLELESRNATTEASKEKIKEEQKELKEEKKETEVKPTTIVKEEPKVEKVGYELKITPLDDLNLKSAVDTYELAQTVNSSYYTNYAIYSKDSRIRSFVENILPAFRNAYDTYMADYAQLCSFGKLDSMEDVQQYTDYFDVIKSDLVTRCEQFNNEFDCLDFFNLPELSPDDTLTNEFNVQKRHNILLYNEESINECIDSILRDGSVNDSHISGFIKTFESKKIFKERTGKTFCPLKGDGPLDKYNPYRFRSGLRSTYVLIPITDSNRKEIKERYGLEDNDFNIFFTWYILKNQDSKDGEYKNAFRIGNALVGVDDKDVGTIKWLYGLFGNDFSPSTRDVAFDYIDQNIRYEELNLKGGESHVQGIA